jgi:Uri superfamily endonuclease
LRWDCVIMAVPRARGRKADVMKSSSSVSGSYILIVRLRKVTPLEPGSLGKRLFSAGYYAYVGSAMGGLKPRLRRHLSKNKIPRWHIDYLTKKGAVTSITVLESAVRVECNIAKALESQFASVAGFGCSDCDCSSHLFFAPHEEEMKEGVERALTLIKCPFKVLIRKDIPAYLGLSRS